MRFMLRTQRLLADGGEMDIRDIERGFRDAALRDGDAAFRHFLAMLEPSAPECPECRVMLKKLSMRTKTVVSLMGSGELERGYYECPNGHGHFIPCDDIAGLGGTSFTPGVKYAVSKLASAGSFEWTSETLAEIAGIYVSPKESQRISEAAGEAIESKNKWRIEAAMQPVPPSRNGDDCAAPIVPIASTMYIEYDGTGIPMTGKALDGRIGKQADGSAKTREVKLGCIFTQTAFDEKGHPVRDDKSTSYVGAIENSESFGWRIFAEASRRNLFAYKRVIVLGDGAKWIWCVADLHFPDAIQIIDLYHAKEHLHGLIRAIFPDRESQDKATEEWIELLEAGKIEELVSKMCAVGSLDEEQTDKVSTESNYFASNADRMRYKKFKDMGLFVGSGVIKAGCKTVIGRRLKQSGMFWSLNGANAIVALRCADLSCNEDIYDYFEPESRFAQQTVS